MIQVIHRAVAMLEYLAEDPVQPRRLKAIAEHLHLNLATCANILKTLAERGLVAKHGLRSGYQLGPWIDHIGRKSPYRQGLVQAAEPEIVRLANMMHATALLVVIHQGRRYVLCHANGNRAMQIRPDFIFSENIYQSASGRLLLANLPVAEQKEFVRQQGLPGRSWPNIAGAAQVYRALEQIRRQGLAFRKDHRFEDIMEQTYGVACPVRQGKTVVAAVALLIPALRFQGRTRPRIICAVQDTAARISHDVELARMPQPW